MAKVKKRKTKRRPLPEALQQDTRAKDRQKYRKNQTTDFELTGGVTLRSLDFFEEMAEELPVINLMSSETETLPVLRLTPLAKLLNVSYQTLWRWTTETQQLPRPVLVDNTTGREYPVYHLEEVRVMITVIGQHLRAFKYYRKDHEATKKQVFDQIDALRAHNFGNEKGHNHGNQTLGQTARQKVRRRPGKHRG